MSRSTLVSSRSLNLTQAVTPGASESFQGSPADPVGYLSLTGAALTLTGGPSPTITGRTASAPLTLEAAAQSDTIVGATGDTLLASALSASLVASSNGLAIGSAAGGGTLVASSPNVTLEVAAAAALPSYSLVGNSSDTTLALMGGGQVGDALFNRVKGAKALSLDGGSAVTLGPKANSAGISTVYGGSASTSFVQASSGNFVLDLVGKSGNDLFVLPSARACLLYTSDAADE